jgi:hypothetical protein
LSAVTRSCDQDPGAWAAAVAAWEGLAMPYAAAYCRWRQAEAAAYRRGLVG